MRDFLERYFEFRHLGTNWRTEILAGVTTFLTMAYIALVNPAILSAAGVPLQAVTAATCLSAAFGSILMGVFARYPIALAPGMGLNAFFAFTVVLGHKYTWQQALAGVFCSGVLFFLISIFNIREYIINSIPKNLKLAISAGVGLFLGIIALEEAKIVVANPATLVTLGDLKQWPAILCLAGFIVIVALNYRNVIGATLIGILAATLIGLPLGLAEFTGIVSAPPSLAPTFLQLDFSRIAELTFTIIVFSFLMVDVFDNAGTLIGVAHRAGLLDADGNLPRMKQALLADSFAAMFGALIGTSTTTSYIETPASASAPRRPRNSPSKVIMPAIANRLRTFGAESRSSVDNTGPSSCNLVRAATGRAPAVVAAVTMPLTYSIATGIGLGFITYALAKLIAGKFDEAKPAVVILAVIFAIKFALPG